MSEEVTREQLKVNALLERIAGLENEKAEMRVDIHVLALQNEELRNKISEWENSVQKGQEADKPTK